MKYLTFFLFLFCNTYVCGQNNQVTIYLTTDSILSSHEQWIYAFTFDGNDTFLQDSALVNSKNKNIVLRTELSEERQIQIVFSVKGPNHLFLTASPNDTIYVTVNEEDGGGMVWKNVIGSYATNEKAKIMEHTKRIRLRLLDLEGAIMGEKDSIEVRKLTDTIRNMKKELLRQKMDIIMNSPSPDNVFCALVTPDLIQEIGLDSVEVLRSAACKRFPNHKRLLRLYNHYKSPPATKESKKAEKKLLQIIRNKTNNIKKEKEKSSFPKLIEENGSSQNIFPIKGQYALYNFSLKNSDEKVINFSSLCMEDKFILIEFWASWCIPCIKSMGLLKKIHNSYKEKISICLISMDSNKEYWINAIKRHKLQQFTNLIATENGILNKDIERLNIEKIPQNYLLSPKGHIIATNIFNENLVDKLNELIK